MSNFRPYYGLQGSVSAFQALPPTPHTILVVDDSEVARTTYIQYLNALSDRPYAFLEAGTLTAGLELWRSHTPDLVLLDVRLPDGDGLQFLEMIGQEPSEGRSPVIVLTGHGDERTAVQAMKLGAADYLVKGDITALSLFTCINQVWERAAMKRQLLRSQRQEALLADIAFRLRQHYDITEILSAIAHEAREFLESDRILIYQLDLEGRGEIIAEAVATPWASCLDAPCIDLSFPDNLGAACREGNIFAVADIETAHLSGDYLQRLHQAQVKATLVMPILRPPEVAHPLWGLLVVHQCTAPRSWEDREIAFLQQLSVQLAIALHQMALNRSLQALNASLEQKVEERTRELHTAYEQVQQELEERRRTESVLETLALERQQTLLSLQESEQRYATLAASVPVGIFRTNAWGSCIYVNQRCCEITGLDPECALDFSWHGGIHPEDREKVVAEAARAIQENRSFLMEYRFLHPDGTVRWVLVQTEAERDAAGNVMGYVGSLTDISDRKHNEQTSHLLAAVVESSDDAIITKNLDGIITSWNIGATRLFGYTEAEAVGQPISILFEPGARDTEPSISERIQRGDRIEHFETVRLHQDGTPVEVSITVSPLRNEAGQITGISKIVRDITERKRWEKALQDSEAHHRALIQALPDLIMRINREGIYLEFVATPNFYVVGNIPEMVGTHVSETLPPDVAQKRIVAIQRALETNTVQIYEQDLSINGRTQVEEVRVVPYNDGEVLALVRDISDRKQAEFALKQSEAQSRAILSAIPDLLFRVGADGVYREFVTSRDFDLVPLASQSIGRSMAEILGPELAERQWHYLQQALQTGQLQVYEQRIQVGDRLQDEEVRVVPSGDDEVLFMVRNISDRKQAELALAASEAQKSAVLAAIPDLMLRVGAEGTIREYITQHRELDIISPSIDPVGQLMGNLVPKDVALRNFQYIQEAIRTGELQVYEQRVQVGDRLQDEEVRIIKSGDDEALFMIRDITERKRTEAALKQSEQTNRIIIESIPDLLIHMDREGHYSQMLGGSGVRVKQPTWSSTEPEIFNVLPRNLAEQRLYYANCAIETGCLQVYEQIFDLDGEVSYEEVRVAPLSDREVLIIIRDVTDRKRAEAERLQAEKARLELKLLEQILDIVLAGYWDWDIPNHQEYLSPGFKRMFGYNDDELPNTPEAWQSIIFPEDLPGVMACYDRHVQSRGMIPFYNEVRYCHKDGSTVWVICSGQVIEWDAAGQPLRMIGCHINISDRKRAEMERQRLIQELSEFKLALDEAAIVAITDAQGVITYANDRFCDISGYSRAELIGQTHRLVNSGHHSGEFFKDLWDTVARGEIWQGEIRNRAKDGEFYWVESTLVPFLDAQGQPFQYLAIRFDITARKLAEVTIQQENAFRQQIVENMAEGLCVCHGLEAFPHLNFTVWNQQMVQITGYTREDINTLGWHILYPDPETQEQAIARMSRMQENNFAIAEEWEIQRQDGQRRTIAIATSTLANSEGQIYVLALIQDITARKQAETALQKSNEELARATRLKDEFLATMSHELRTPLNAILGMTEGLAEAVFGEINPKQLRAIQTIERSGYHLLELINDILDIAKIESGQMELDCVPIPVAPLCHASMTFVKQQAEKKNIALLMNLPTNLPRLLVDERRIRQVLINLLNNAVKFTPKGGRITLSVSYQANSSAQPQTLLRIAVSDTGIGIAPENISKLFKPFIQIDSALNRKYEGTGLGLALVKRIVELHGGQVSLSSEVGVGSCFMVDLPYMPGEATPAPTNPDRQKSPEAVLAFPVAPLILLAEDNEANIGTVSSYLQAKGYRILLAKNGQQAITLAQTQAPHLILMDIQMAEMDGLEAMAAIRQIPQLEDTPIIAMTALAMAGDRDRCLAAGANDYITKPIKLKQLVTAIENLLVSRGDTL